MSKEIEVKVADKKPGSSLVTRYKWLFVCLGVGLLVATSFIAGKIYTDVSMKRDDAKQTIQEVKKIILAPTETPTVATVTDVTKLSGQAFFKDALDGDKVLVYAKAKVAILYRPSKHMIINVGPVAVTTTPTPTPIVVQTPQPTGSISPTVTPKR